MSPEKVTVIIFWSKGIMSLQKGFLLVFIGVKA